MAGPVLVVGAPSAKWEVALVSSQSRFSALSPADPVVVSVRGYSGGTIADPTAGTGQLAFMPSPLAQPGDGDWKAAAWDTTDIGDYVLEAAIGSAGAVQLAPGTWWVWAQITLPTYGIVRQTGSIVVE